MEKYLSNQGTKIWTISSGKGIPCILCAGGPGCDDYLEPVAKILESQCQIIRFEPRGCGRSDYDGQYDLATSVDDIEFIRREYGFEKIIIGGHSAGVDFALAYSLKYAERVIGMIGISGGRIVNDREWSAVYKKNQQEVGEDYGGKVFIADPQVNKIGNRSWRDYIKKPDLLKEISEMTMRVVLIFGEKDIRPNWPTKQLASLIPQGHYLEMEGAAHNMWLTHSEELGHFLEKSINLILD